MVLNLKERNKKSTELSITDLARIKSIFIQKDWPIKDHFNEGIFDNFCKTLQNLSPEQSNLLISLTENFLWVKDNDYMAYFAESFNKFINSYNFDSNKRIFICPLLPEDDFGQPKSSVYLLYQIKAHMQALQNHYQDFSISYFDSPTSVNMNLINDGSILCLVDDFIGSGKTAESAANYFLDREISKSNIVILSLVAMEEGLLYLKNNDYTVFTNISCEKGLSPHAKDDEIKIMQAIENKIKVKESYRFGFEGSEALVKMMRTPNNTFPIYWLRNKTNSYAPFPR